MSNYLSYLTFLLIFSNISNNSIKLDSCIPGRDHCAICNPLKDLCHKCDQDNLIPDDKGGCEYKKICRYGYNYCQQCSKEEPNLCTKCEDGYFPDEYGGCSYTKNCILSERGKCLKCKDNYILIGIENYFHEGIKICKSLFSEDIRFCETINENSGLCDKCQEGYYLNRKDKKCSSTRDCEESIFGVCTKCIYTYYLDKKNNECKNQTDKFIHCIESINGENCDVCEENFFFDEDGKCIFNNYCLKEKERNKCNKCVDNYYLTEKEFTCTPEKNCKYGDRTLGTCALCKDNYYIDYKDGKCKSNLEDNDFKYCYIANDVCIECIIDYYVGTDNKCSTTRNCSESYNGTCIECINNYYLGLDNKCTNVKHCIYSDQYNNCLECEGDYYYNRNEKKCKIGEGKLLNCKISYSGSFCENCKDDYYLNQTDFLCYSNEEQGTFYKCAMTDIYGDYCIFCRKDYYMGEIDNKCSRVEGCAISENDDTCLECEEYYCLDAKTGKCVDNDFIDDEKKMFYYNCNRTNKEGNRCEICIDGFKPNENGLCVNDNWCEEKVGDKCQKCKNDEGDYCLNEYFGCVEIGTDNCLECNDLIDLYSCTKCSDGYEIDDYYGRCIKVENNNQK